MIRRLEIELDKYGYNSKVTLDGEVLPVKGFRVIVDGPGPAKIEIELLGDMLHLKGAVDVIEDRDMLHLKGAIDVVDDDDE